MNLDDIWPYYSVILWHVMDSSIFFTDDGLSFLGIFYYMGACSYEPAYILHR